MTNQRTHTDTAEQRGFTLIELLIVVVVLGILAALAIPQYTSTKGASYDAKAKSDLRNLVSEQEMHLISFGQYASDITTSGSSDSTTVVFNGSSGLTVGQDIDITDGGGTGSPVRYTVQAKHPGSDNCWEISVGPNTTHRLVKATSCSVGGG